MKIKSNIKEFIEMQDDEQWRLQTVLNFYDLYKKNKPEDLKRTLKFKSLEDLKSKFKEGLEFHMEYPKMSPISEALEIISPALYEKVKTFEDILEHFDDLTIQELEKTHEAHRFACDLVWLKNKEKNILISPERLKEDAGKDFKHLSRHCLVLDNPGFYVPFKKVEDGRKCYDAIITDGLDGTFIGKPLEIKQDNEEAHRGRFVQLWNPQDPEAKKEYDRSKKWNFHYDERDNEDEKWFTDQSELGVNRLEELGLNQKYEGLIHIICGDYSWKRAKPVMEYLVKKNLSFILGTKHILPFEAYHVVEK